MVTEWNVEKLIEGCGITCKHTYQSESRHSRDSYITYRPSINPDFEFCVCLEGNRHVRMRGEDQKLVSARKYAKFYPVMTA
jgi:hypothetical protein